MLSGDNGILQKATAAKENTDSAQIKEKIQLAYHSALTVGQGSYTKESLEDELEKEFGENNYNVDDSDNTNWILTAQGQSVTIPAGREDISKKTIKVGTTNIKGISDLTTLYGETTDYTSVQGVQWQLFYSDKDNIYLIASDYVPNSTLPNELLKSDSEYYGASFATWVKTGIYSGHYEGKIMEEEPWSIGRDSSTITENAQTNTYLQWIKYSKDNHYSDTSEPLRALAYLMDTNKWTDFAGDAQGATAIGGPTLEMFAKSWNSNSAHPQMTNWDVLSNGNASYFGYILNSSEGGADFFGNSTNMWFISEKNKAVAYWIAAPVQGQGTLHLGVVSAEYGMKIMSALSVVNYGFRPLVTIPKSSLK